MLNYIEFYGDGFGRDVTSAGSPKIEGIEGNGPLRVGEIRRNPATIPLAKFLSTSSRVQTGSSELPCCRSGWSEKRPSIIHDSVFSARFSKFLALSVRIPFFSNACDTQKSGHL